VRQKHYNSRFVRWALTRGWLDKQKMSIIDVGASGGLDNLWRQFHPYLEAVGFDPLLAEVGRLNAAESNHNVRYEAGWVGDGTTRSLPQNGLYPFSTSSAAEAARISQRDYAQIHFNSGQKVVYSDRQITLDQFIADRDRNSFDALKIDTDGLDYFVLEGARKLLSEGRILVVECECQMHEIRPGWPCFADIDRFMRAAGYRLIDLDPWRYTRACLPGRFLYNLHAQTEGGQVHFCDALYMLDAALDEASMERLRADPAKLIKLVLLQVAFGYPDLAVSTLLVMRKQKLVPDKIAVDAALDLLVPPSPYGATTYRDYIDLFAVDPDNFLPSRWERSAHKPSLNRTRLFTIELDRLQVQADWARSGAKLESSKAGIKICTPSKPWHYTAVAPIGPLPQRPKDSRLFLRVHVSQVEGQAMLSLFHAESNTIHGEMELLPGAQSQSIDFVIDSGISNLSDHFLIRNGKDDGVASSLVVEKMEIVAAAADRGW
jgi:FkbM family methyltransferase